MGIALRLALMMLGLGRAVLLCQMPQEGVLTLASVVWGLTLEEGRGWGQVRHGWDGEVMHVVWMRVDVQVRERVRDRP